ncbi:hypothetical protein GQ42DRAFT_123376, partial [Ramicandelaber brevisporus]
ITAEIDRCLKKVSEGMEEFEIIYDKVMNAPTHAQKEKLETDLKKEIKKLQRCREQIKGWLATNEIKDKRELTETRKLIEKQMEKFKAVEKEMKTKAFSKEGLAQMTKIDPKDKERMEARQWLTESVDSLQTQIDLKEAEHEQIATQMNATGRRATGKKELAEKLKEIEHRIERHKWHVGRLERIMRLLENDGLTADEANAIREDIEYYVNSNDQDEFEEDDGIYENMNLDDDVDLYGIVDDYTTNNTNIHTESDTDHSDIDSPRQSASPLSNNILPLPIIAKPSQSKPTATLMKRSQTTAASIVHQPTAASDIPSLLGLSAGSSSNAPSAFSEIVAAIRDTYALNPNAPLSTPNQRRQFFDASVQCIPDLLDGEHSTPYIPRNPADTPSYYPQLPPSSLKLSNRRLFERLNLETLFYIFYHQQDTPQQYLAAHELKKQSWRFHKQHATWFQRFNEPTTVTDEFEKGTYAYFDFEDGWRQRKRDGFCFEYKELEDSNLDLPKSANKTTTATAVAAAQ